MSPDDIISQLLYWTDELNFTPARKAIADAAGLIRFLVQENAALKARLGLRVLSTDRGPEPGGAA